MLGSTQVMPPPKPGALDQDLDFGFGLDEDLDFGFARQASFAKFQPSYLNKSASAQKVTNGAPERARSRQQQGNLASVPAPAGYLSEQNLNQLPPCPAPETDFN